jgi:hypothetical protein
MSTVKALNLPEKDFENFCAFLKSYSFAHMQGWFASMMAELKQYALEMKNLEARLTNAAKPSEVLKQGILDLKNLRLDITGTFITLTEKNQILTDKVITMEKAIKTNSEAYTLRQKIFAFEKQASEFQTELISLKKELAQSIKQEEYSDLQLKTSLLELENTTLRQEIEELKKENADLKEQLRLRASASSKPSYQNDDKSDQGGFINRVKSELFELNLNVNTLLSYKNDCILFRKISFKKRELQLKRTFKSFDTKIKELQVTLEKQSDFIRLSNIDLKASLNDIVRQALSKELEETKQNLSKEVHAEITQAKREIKKDVNKRSNIDVDKVVNKEQVVNSGQGNGKVMPKTNRIEDQSITYENNLIMCLSIEAREKFAFGQILTPVQRQAVGNWWVHACYLDRSHMSRLLYFATTKFTVVARAV